MNFNNKLKIFGLCLFASFTMLLTSCEDFLSPEQTDAFDSIGAFETIEDADKALLGVYAALDNHVGRYIGNEAVLADDLKITADNSGKKVSLHNWLFNASNRDVDGLYSLPYVLIYRANIVLDGLSIVSDGTDAERNQIRGEALALRALAHFDLVRAFGDNYNTASQYGIPYVKELTTDGLPRNDVQVTYQSVMDDLTAARGLMTNTFTDDVTFFSPEACTALMARVALYMENWTMAKNLATEAITATQGVGLASTTDYEGMFSLAESTGEYIFRAGVPADGLAVGTTWYTYQGATIVNEFAPTVDLISLVQSGDVRAGVLVTTDFGETIVNKYPGNPQAELEGIGDIPIARISELYLIRAEANYRLMDEGGARTDMDAVRTARIPGYTSQGEAGTALLDAIVNERRIELAFEGHRFFDLKRWGASITRTDCPVATNCTLSAGAKYFVLPIPTHELGANRNITQYPNY